MNSDGRSGPAKRGIGEKCRLACGGACPKTYLVIEYPRTVGVSMDLFQKCVEWDEAKRVIALGLYPYFHPVNPGSGAVAIIDGRETIMLGSNNYLGLTTHPRVKQAAIDAVEEFGSSCTGSRFLNGTMELHHELERRLATFVHKESALVFSTGFQTNLGVISTLIGRQDIVFSDREDHASIIDGCRLSFGRHVKFRHQDMDDLRRALEQNDGERGKLIVVDGVYSMSGEVVDLPGVVELAKEFGARLMVDDAHSVGVMGEHGRGTAEHFGLEDDVDLVMGTFSKSLASLGGFIAGPEAAVHYIKHHARSLIFSASMPPASVAAALAALEVLEEEPERVHRLRKIAHRMREGLRSIGYDAHGSITPIIPIVLGTDYLHTFRVWKELLEAGVFTNPVIEPAVPPGQQMLRTSYMATHEDHHLDRALEAFETIGKKMGLIG
jgi:8-amino-7-oxononanoate synthase